ncbi:hypothetical protein ABZ725_52125 [Streptomyces sp. NPDC006872]|uniref:hypothetical protein n=1 Tax=Streptomyces sp. NPDC006872 TaxID=3155720 RepID=UPI0033BFFDC6
MTGRRWFESQALAVAAAVAVAVGLYVWRGGHYPLPVDLMALTAVALVVYTGARQLTLARTTDTKENDPVTDLPIAPRDEHSSSAGDPADLEAILEKAGRDGQPFNGTWRAAILSSGRYISTPEEFEALRQAVSTVEIPADMPRWHPNEIADWMTSVVEDESASEDDLRRAALAEAYALGIEPDDLEATPAAD